jgi:hypothetical protein
VRHAACIAWQAAGFGCPGAALDAVEA